MYKFKFADIGEGLHEGVVAEIYVTKGQDIKEGDSLFSVETDKVTSDIPSPVDGKVLEILMKVGETIHVGNDVMHFDANGQEAPAAETKKEEAPKAVAKPAPVATPVAAPAPTQVSSNTDILATPFARSLAASKGIDLSQVQGTGSQNRILVADIESFVPGAAKGVSKTPARKVRLTQDVTTPVKPMRNAIARAMKKSWSDVAYTSLVTEVNMTTIWDERKGLVPEILAATGTKLSFTAFIAKATAIALTEFPMLNAKYNEAKGEITQFAGVNLGLAVDTEAGLMVPVITDADTKSVIEIAQDISKLAKKARDKKLTAKDMSGATFTLTNYGSVGALYGVPVINVGEIGIIGTGAIIDRVYADPKGSFYNGKVMHLTTAADHRWVDGGDIGRFNMRVKELLEKPSLLIMLGGL